MSFSSTYFLKSIINIIEQDISTAPIHKALSQLPEQERDVSTSVQNSSILAPNAKRSYLGVQLKTAANCFSRMLSQEELIKHIK